MKMRKIALICALATGLGVAGIQQVSARGWGGGYGGDCGCPGYGAGYQQMDASAKEKIDAFRADTQELRKQIAIKRAEKRALMSSQNPDPVLVGKVAGELFDLRTEMQEKAVAAGVPAQGWGKRGMRGGGKGGPGKGMRPCISQSSL